MLHQSIRTFISYVFSDMLTGMNNKIALILVLIGISTYKISVDYLQVASWPGLLIIIIGLLLLSYVYLKKSITIGRQKGYQNKSGLIGAIILLLGLMSLAGIPFAQNSFSIFYIFWVTVPLISIGLVLAVINFIRNH